MSMQANFSRYPFPRYPMNNITPFTYRDGVTFLEIITQLRRDFELVRASDESQGEVILDFVEAMNITIAELLSQLIGYTIEVTENMYTASMMDGSEFTAYTLEGVDNLLETLTTTLTDFINTNISDIRVENEVVQTQLAQDIANAVEANNLAIANAVEANNLAITDVLETIEKAFSYRHNVIDYGAVGDGIADDGLAIKAAFDACMPGQQVFFPDGFVFRTTVPVVCAKANITVTGPGLITVAAYQPMTDKTLFRMTGDNIEFDGIKIDGGSSIAQAIVITGAQATVRNCNIQKLYATNAGSRAIYVTTTDGAVIEGNLIDDVNARGDGIVANENGAARGITLYLTSKATAPSRISNNIVRNIRGEEGDAIHVLCDNGGLPVFPDAWTTIESNIISEFNKRAVKVQGSSVVVKDNVIRSGMEANASGSYYAINVIHSSRVEIVGNTISGGNMDALSIQGNDASKSTNNVVRNNIIVNGNTKYALYSNYNDRLIIEGNKFSDGLHGVRLISCNYASVKGNEFVSPSSTGRVNARVYTDVDCWRAMVDGNTFNGSAESSMAVVEMYGAEASVINNIDFMVTPGAFCRISGETVLLYVSNNRSFSSVFLTSVSGFYNNNVAATNYGNSRANMTLWASDIPTTAHPLVNFQRGDVCFNSGVTNGTVTGWICTVSGKPGTWRAM